ncbi:type I-E CRISPR-associated protein Cse2/CasB [Silvanigrella aquatica]|uniref:Type I-E CRISPR-associated protein Cse2/CasB n=1 Tax=Silvanigrella aquatica TaxID=1915309 RepID=A0A1L4CXW6_9BACT|nr:type I-E CRISPR-associated protein Cse2/CasB [Silvanigrella aquatica]APJ02803.1 hypothetical protein AXG55_02225 [Silvanigrella aquatica]
MSEQYSFSYDEAKKYLYSIAHRIENLIEEREKENTPISKEIIAHLRRSRKNNNNEHYILHSLNKLRLIEDEKYSILSNNYFFNILKMIIPIHSDLGAYCLKFEIDENAENSNFKAESKNFGYSLGKLLAQEEIGTVENVEKKFLKLLSTPLSQIENQLYSVISSLLSTFGKLYIDWPLLYVDLYLWEYDEKIQYKWSKSFYKYVAKDEKNKK